MDALFTRRLALFGAFLAIVTFHVGCVRAESLTHDSKTYQYGVPERLNDGWETASLSGVSLDTNLIRELFARIGNNSYKNIHSVLLVKNGKLVVEEYFPGQDSTG
jgi:hypothetical protein